MPTCAAIDKPFITSSTPLLNVTFYSNDEMLVFFGIDEKNTTSSKNRLQLRLEAWSRSSFLQAAHIWDLIPSSSSLYTELRIQQQMYTVGQVD